MLRDSAVAWKNDGAPRLGAALAFYTAFSLAPVLIIVIAVAATVFGRDAAQVQLLAEIKGMIGAQGAVAIQAMVDSAYRSASGATATLVGGITLLIGASALYAELQAALNVIWRAPPRRGNPVLSVIRARLLSFSLVVATGFLLLVSLAVSAALAAIDAYVAGVWSEAALLLRVLSSALSFALIAAMFAMMFKVLPDAAVGWRDVWPGAALTAGLFTIGKLLIGLYLGNSAVASAYGAAGSLVVVLLWVYYSAQIMLFGAEFTRLYAARRGSGQVNGEAGSVEQPVAV